MQGQRRDVCVCIQCTCVYIHVCMYVPMYMYELYIYMVKQLRISSRRLNVPTGHLVLHYDNRNSLCHDNRRTGEKKATRVRL